MSEFRNVIVTHEEREYRVCFYPRVNNRCMGVWRKNKKRGEFALDMAGPLARKLIQEARDGSA